MEELGYAVEVKSQNAAQSADADGKVLYVWFDAPIGYISMTKEWALTGAGVGAGFGTGALIGLLLGGRNILSSACCGVPFAEVQVPAVDGDDSLPGGLVAAIGRDAKSGRFRHGSTTSSSPNPVDYRISLNLRLHCRTSTGNRNCCFSVS